VTPAVIETDALTSYGRARGIEDVSMTVEPGEAFGFLGSNGAGALLAVTGALLFDRRDVR
jgi:ABC-type multidrug transport system ATPase subunit